MTTSPSSDLSKSPSPSEPPAEGVLTLRVWLTIAGAALLFVLSWTAIHHGPWKKYELGHNELVDTPVYQEYGNWIVGEHRVPYSNFKLEYPPAAIPIFALPSIGISDEPNPQPYRDRFELEMLLCGIALVVFVGLALARLRGELGLGLASRLAFVAVAPMLLGTVILTRFDLWPAALTAAALAAILWARNWLGIGTLAVAVAAKVYPGVLLVPFLLRIYRREGRREMIAAIQIFVIVSVPLFLPFLLTAPREFSQSVWRQVSRPMQIESLGSSLLIGLHNAVGLDVSVVTGSGSQNLSGTGTTFMAVLSTIVEIALLIAAWVWFARGEPTNERFLRVSAASVATFVAFGKVLSPQFMIWLLPVVVLVAGRRGRAAIGLTALALVLTQVWFPSSYWDFVNGLDGGLSTVVLLRNLTLVALVVVLLWPLEGMRWERKRAEEPAALGPPLGGQA